MRKKQEPRKAAFEEIFDDAVHVAETVSGTRRRNKGRASGEAKPIPAQPALTTSAEKPRRRKAIVRPETRAATPSVVTLSDLDASGVAQTNYPSHPTRTRRKADSDSIGHISSETPRARADAIAEIQQLWRMRQRWHRAEKALILQSKAICRAFCDGDKDEANKAFEAAAKGSPTSHDIAAAMAPFLPAIELFANDRARIEKTMAKAAKALPTYAWATSFKGLGDMSFVALIGELGELSQWRSVSCVWKRMGLAVIDGERQRKKANVEEAAIHGYSPSRRSVMWNVGGGLIGGMGHGPRPMVGEDVESRDDLSVWQKLFIERCRYLVAREPEEYERKPVEKADKETGEVRHYESYSKKCAASAKRYVEKRFIRKMYARWKLETTGVSGDPDDIALPIAAE